MTPAQLRAERQYLAQARVVETIYQELRSFPDATVADIVDPARMAAHERWCSATLWMMTLFERSPSGKRFETEWSIVAAPFFTR